VTASTSDLNPDDSTVVTAVQVVPPTADLAISLVGAPDPILSGNHLTYSITVSNFGPATATGVTLTNILPGGVSISSVSPVGYSLFGNSVIWTNLGNLGSGLRTTASIVVVPNIGGTLTNIASCASSIPDPFKLNNVASIKTVVEPVQAGIAIVGNSLVITWSADAAGYYVESAPSLQPPVTWTQITSPPPVNIGGVMTLTLPLGPGTEYFRLHGQSQ
jgi:uncharacterized repeat protein (TIGR01451 family)